MSQGEKGEATQKELAEECQDGQSKKCSKGHGIAHEEDTD